MNKLCYFTIRQGVPEIVDMVAKTSDGRLVGQFTQMDLANLLKSYHPLKVGEVSKVASDIDAALESDPVLLNEADWAEALGSLPPKRWHRHEGVELFHLSEMYGYYVATFFAKFDGMHLRFRAHKDTPSDMLVKKVRKHLDMATLV